MPLQQTEHVSRSNDRRIDQLSSAGKQQRPIVLVGRTTSMGTADQSCLQRNYVHQHAKAELPLKKTPGNFRFHAGDRRVQEQFNRIVARLSVDIDSASKI